MSADTIFIMPSETAGTMWELALLRSDSALLEKTIFIMPPMTSAFDTQAQWVGAATMATTVGYTLPEYRASGLFFLVGSDGRMLRDVPIPKTWTPNALAKALTNLRDDGHE